MDDYVSAVCVDIAANGAPPAACPAPLRTVFFGGGTPSLLPPPQLARILDALRRAFGIAPDAEVSMEMDPGATAASARGALFAVVVHAEVFCSRRAPAGTFDAASLAAYMALGVTRVNLGVQSFDAAMLKGAHSDILLPPPPPERRASAQAAAARTPPMTWRARWLWCGRRACGRGAWT